MLLCQIRFLMQPSNENAIYNILYYLHKKETYCMSNPKPIHGPKTLFTITCTKTSLKSSPGSSFLRSGQKGNSRKEKPLRYILYGTAEGALNQMIIQGWHLLAIFIFLDYVRNCGKLMK